MGRPDFWLIDTIGRSYRVDPNDIVRTKQALRKLGYFETPRYGVTPYPDEPMFQGIEEFQNDFDLFRDGTIRPNGKTARKLNEILDLKDRLRKSRVNLDRIANANLSRQILRGTDQDQLHQGNERKKDQQELAFAPAVPIIVYEIAILFGMTLAAAYSWWLSKSAEEKRQIRKQVEDAQSTGFEEDPTDSECERLLKIDTDTCRQIAKKRGSQAGQRCYASAMRRYAACRAGKPKEHWPPLDTWNN